MGILHAALRVQLALLSSHWVSSAVVATRQSNLTLFENVLYSYIFVFLVFFTFESLFLRRSAPWRVFQGPSGPHRTGTMILTAAEQHGIS